MDLATNWADGAAGNGPEPVSTFLSALSYSSATINCFLDSSISPSITFLCFSFFSCFSFLWTASEESLVWFDKL